MCTANFMYMYIVVYKIRLHCRSIASYNDCYIHFSCVHIKRDHECPAFMRAISERSIFVIDGKKNQNVTENGNGIKLQSSETSLRVVQLILQEGHG